MYNEGLSLLDSTEEESHHSLLFMVQHETTYHHETDYRQAVLMNQHTLHLPLHPTDASMSAQLRRLTDTGILLLRSTARKSVRLLGPGKYCYGGKGTETRTFKGSFTAVFHAVLVQVGRVKGIGWLSAGLACV